MDQEKALKKLRAEIVQADAELLRLVAHRMELARQVGTAKLQADLPIKDFKVEKEVIENNRKRARELGLSEEAAEEITRTLITFSCRAQEELQGKAKARKAGDRRKVVIVGGQGQMGRWLARFFEAFGHEIAICDTKTAAGVEFPVLPSLKQAAEWAEVVLFATPLSQTAALMEELIPLKPKGLVFDICSLKGPVQKTIAKARQAGMKITSVHPMFGPGTDWLAGKNVLLCDTGDSAALEAAADLFRESTANLIKIPLDQHDPLMGFVLGLSHLNNLVFGTALARSGFTFERLSAVGSTTFQSQVGVAEPVASENPDLYYEIQAENDSTHAVGQLLSSVLQEYLTAIADEDRAAFRALMEKARDYFKRPRG